MNTKQFQDHMANLFNACLETSKKKNSDYANNDADPFQNFRVCEKAFAVPAEIGIMVRLTDKIARAGNIIQKQIKGQGAAVVDESLQDTLEDAINYCAILHAYLSEKGESAP